MRIRLPFVLSFAALALLGCGSADEPDTDLEADEEAAEAASAVLTPGATSVSFGGVKVGCTSRTSVRLVNTGGVPTTIVSVTSSNPSVFGTGTLPSVINPGASANLGIGFSPAAQVSYTETITIQSNDGLVANPAIVINVGGNGLPPDPC